MNEECRKCGTINSVFWWPFSLSDKNTVYLCDDCAYELVKWLNEPPKKPEMQILPESDLSPSDRGM